MSSYFRSRLVVLGIRMISCRTIGIQQVCCECRVNCSKFRVILQYSIIHRRKHVDLHMWIEGVREKRVLSWCCWAELGNATSVFGVTTSNFKFSGINHSSSATWQSIPRRSANNLRHVKSNATLFLHQVLQSIAGCCTRLCHTEQIWRPSLYSANPPPSSHSSPDASPPDHSPPWT